MLEAIAPPSAGGLTVATGIPIFIAGGDAGTHVFTGPFTGDVTGGFGFSEPRMRSCFVAHSPLIDRELATPPFSEVADHSKAFQRFAPDAQLPRTTRQTEQEPPAGVRDYAGEMLVAMTRGETPFADAFADLQAGGEMDPGVMEVIEAIAERDVEAIFRDPRKLIGSLRRLSGRLRGIEEIDPASRPFLSEEVSETLASIDWGTLWDQNGLVLFRALDELGASFLYLDTMMRIESGARDETRLEALKMYQVLSHDFENWDQPQPVRVMAIAHLLRNIFEPLGLTEVPFPDMSGELLSISVVGSLFMLSERNRYLAWLESLSSERKMEWQREDEHRFIEELALHELSFRTAYYYEILQDSGMMNLVAETSASAMGHENGVHILESYGKAMESHAFRFAAVLGRDLTQLHPLVDPDYVLMRAAVLAEVSVISTLWPLHVTRQVSKGAAGIIRPALGERMSSFMHPVTVTNFVSHVFGSVADRLPDGDESKAVLMGFIESFEVVGKDGN